MLLLSHLCLCTRHVITRNGFGSWTAQGPDGRGVPFYSEIRPARLSYTWRGGSQCMTQLLSVMPCRPLITRSSPFCAWRLEFHRRRQSFCARDFDTRGLCRQPSSLISLLDPYYRQLLPSWQPGTCIDGGWMGLKAIVPSLHMVRLDQPRASTVSSQGLGGTPILLVLRQLQSLPLSTGSSVGPFLLLSLVDHRLLLASSTPFSPPSCFSPPLASAGPRRLSCPHCSPSQRGGPPISLGKASAAPLFHVNPVVGWQ